MDEFGQKIPWLLPLQQLGLATNASYFREELISRLGMRDEASLTPLQFTTSDIRREFIGGALHFSCSPERFRDSRNQGLNERLSGEGYQFVSCLQIRKDLRGGRHGPKFAGMVLDSLLKSHGKVWAVVSEPRLAQRYISLFGGTLRSPQENKDGLWILSWENNT
jgi:hypothetical protein